MAGKAKGLDERRDLEWMLELPAMTPRAKRAISHRYWRALRAERRRKRTTLEWLHKKRRITDQEFLVGRALALLIEWRSASFGAVSSDVVFSQRMMVGGALLAEGNLDKPSIAEATELFNATIRDRLNRHTCSGEELRRLKNVLDRSLPERPDLTIVLGHAVLERIRVGDIPHHDVEIVCAALHVIKELWRFELLEDLLDEATGARPRRARIASGHSQPNSLPLGSSRETASPRNGDCQAGEEGGEPVQEAA
jgi:hypothetical protein